jgi:curved DNA-binding protein CbpA
VSDDPYKILQVDPEADPEVIQAAYRRLAQKWHPDVAQSPDAAARMAALNRAWAVLGDPQRRAAFDRERARDGAQRPGRSSGYAEPPPAPSDRPPQTLSSDWTSSVGSGDDPVTMRSSDGLGGAGRPPGNPSGSVLNFGRYAGWSLGEVGRPDLEYLEWLDRMAIGRLYREEIDQLLRRAGRRRAATAEETDRRGLYRRR